MKKIHIVTCTKSKNFEEFKKRPLNKSLKLFKKLYTDEQLSWTICYDNKDGLSDIYNNYITDKYKDSIVLFCHDDVIIDTLFLWEHLNKSPYVVTGLAGTKKIKKQKNTVPAWHLMSEPKDYVGEVKHIKDNVIFTTVFGSTLSNAVLVDGLFIAVNIEKILQTEARFNKKYDFHHYDLAFCFECLKNNVSVGVMPINVIHYGLGDSMLTHEWEKNAKKFLQEYAQII